MEAHLKMCIVDFKVQIIGTCDRIFYENGANYN